MVVWVVARFNPRLKFIVHQFTTDVDVRQVDEDDLVQDCH